MKKILCLLLCFALLGSFSLGTFAMQNPFSDVGPSDPRYEAVSALGEAGILQGRKAGEASPNIAACWVEVLAIAVRTDLFYAGIEYYDAENSETPWYKPYIKYIAENGINLEIPEDITRPVTRGEAAMIFHRVFENYCFIDFNILPPYHFADVPEDSEYYEGVYFMARAGAMCGVEEQWFAPDELISRGDVAAAAARLAGLVPKAPIMELIPEVQPTPDSSGHSPLYIEGLAVEDVISYFAEVCLDTEFGDKEGGSLIRKWANPIYYNVYGWPTDRDMEVLNAFVEKINAIENFPGMYPVEAGADLEIYFYPDEDFVALMGSDFVGCWGGVTFWYDGMHQIYSETICVRTDIPQDARDSIIAEEIYNGLGSVQDTSLREDSLICEWSNSNYDMTAVDELILKLLYHPSIETGMDYAQCEAVIRQLYY